jgi:hypothetical protein
MSTWQEGIDARKRFYLECSVRQAYQMVDGWDKGVPNVERRRALKGDSLCEAAKYQARPLRRADAIRAFVIDGSMNQALPPVTGPGEDTRDGGPLRGLIRLEILSRQADRAKELFPFDDDAQALDDYWEKLTASAFEHMRLLKDTADFHVNSLLRVLYLHGKLPEHLRKPLAAWRKENELGTSRYFAAKTEDAIVKALLEFKYWLDEPFRVTSSSEETDDARNIAAARKKAGVDASDLKTEMTYWSENHQILFATAEYLAGQWMPQANFQAGRQYLRDAAGAMILGTERMERAKPRILAYLNGRLRFGFSEWNAPGYYKEHLQGLFNLADFCLDEGIATKARMVIDLMIFDLARGTLKGSFGVTAGRAYFDQKNCGWGQGIGDFIEVVFGTRDGTFTWPDLEAAVYFATTRLYEVPDALIAIGQDVPARCIDRSRVSIDFDEAEDYGITLTDESDVIHHWWSRSAYFAHDDIRDASIKAAKTYGLEETNPFKVFSENNTLLDVFRESGHLANYAILGPAAAFSLALFGDIPHAEDFARGSALTHANLYTFRNRQAMLSSVQNFRAGQFNFQTQFCQATLGMDATVWTSHPPTMGPMLRERLNGGLLGAIGGFVGGKALVGAVGLAFPVFAAGAGAITALTSAGGAVIGAVAPEIALSADEKSTDGDPITSLFASDGPTYWHGSVTVPRVVQQAGAAIIAYSSKSYQTDLFGDRTHAWFPKPAFDADAEGDPHPSLTMLPSLHGDTNSDGAWIFGRKENGYVALYSAQEPHWAESDKDWADREIYAEGTRNVFILQIGSQDEFGDYSTFKNRVLNARIHVNGLNWASADFQCSYDIPAGGRLELHYDEDEDQTRLSGQPFDDSRFPRFENPYVEGGRVLWGQYEYTIRHDGLALTHDFRVLKDAQKADAAVARQPGRTTTGPLIGRLTCQPQTQLEGKGSTDTPALAVAGSSTFTTSERRLYMAWKGAEDDTSLYWSHLTASGWSPQTTIEDVSSTHGPALIAYRRDATTTALFMAWKGSGDDSALYWSRNPFCSEDGWEPQQVIVGVGSSSRPAVAEFAGTIHMAWKGTDDDTAIYHSRFDGTGWSAQQRVAGVGTSGAPSLAVVADRLHMFWRGVDDDQDIYTSSLGPDVNVSWLPQTAVAYAGVNGKGAHRIASSDTPAVAVSDGAVFLAWTGISDDSALYFTTLEDGTWYGQVKLTGVGTSSAPAVADYDGRFYVVWKGADDDGSLYASVFDQNQEGTGIYFLWPW